MSERKRFVGLAYGMLIFLLLNISLTTSYGISAEPANPREAEPKFWETSARKRFLKTSKLIGLPKNPAKNVILFLGDGMGIPTVSAARFFKTEVEGNLGAVTPQLDFEDWPFHTLARTYDLNTVVTDSASSATAYLAGEFLEI